MGRNRTRSHPTERGIELDCAHDLQRHHTVTGGTDRSLYRELVAHLGRCGAGQSDGEWTHRECSGGMRSHVFFRDRDVDDECGVSECDEFACGTCVI